MKTFQIVTLFALIATSMAFAPNQTPQGTFRLQQMIHISVGGCLDVCVCMRVRLEGQILLDLWSCLDAATVATNQNKA
jgi:hypothetical protein